MTDSGMTADSALRLLDTDLPFWDGPAPMASALLTCWAAAFPLQRAAIAIHRPAVARTSPETVTWPAGSETEARTFAPESFAWRDLPARETEPGSPAKFSIGLSPETCWETVPEDWLALTGRLLEASIRTQEALFHRQLESLAEYAAGAGHEINNPLGTIVGRTSQLLKGETDPDRRRQLELIGAQAYRIRDMISDTMLFARPPAPGNAAVSLLAAFNDTLTEFSERITTAGLQLQVDIPESLSVRIDPVQLRIVFSELLRNSLEARAQQIRITACEQTGPLSVLLRVSDDGAGFSEEQREHAFDPFYSGRQAGRGLGFGLPKCWRIVNQHGGTIHLTARDGETLFAVQLRGA